MSKYSHADRANTVACFHAAYLFNIFFSYRIIIFSTGKRNSKLGEERPYSDGSTHVTVTPSEPYALITTLADRPNSYLHFSRGSVVGYHVGFRGHFLLGP